MKRTHIFIFAICCTISCSECDVEIRPSIFETKAEIQKEFDYSVSEDDINSYLHYLSLSCGKKTQSFDVVKGVDSTPLFFAINFDEGWELISTDKRTPVVIAKCETGSFCLNSINDNMMSWLNCLADEMLQIKFGGLCEEMLEEEALENISLNILFLKAITADPSLFIMSNHKTKSRDDSSGHWSLVDVSTDYLYFDETPKLMSTHWGQTENTVFPNNMNGQYFNAYCPLLSSSNTLRVPAGCEAVAGAQILNYLHGYYGFPTTAPGYASCTGHAPVNYIQTIGSPSSEVWPYMERNSIYNGIYVASALIADMGHTIGIQYDDDASGASLFALYNGLIDKGISCCMDVYDKDVVICNLLDSMPVICRADGTMSNLGGTSYYSNGHCFIIDGYKGYQAIKTYTYAWQYDNPNTTEDQPGELETFEIRYLTPQISHFYMNWGFADDVTDSVEMALSGNWNIGDLNFNYNRAIIYGFEPEQ